MCVSATHKRKPSFLKEDKMNKGKQLIIGMLSGLGSYDPVMKSLMGDAETITDLLGEISITKQDLFDAVRDRKSMFETQKTWDNFPLILNLLERSGERLDVTDMKRTLVGEKSMLDFAIEKKELKHLMVPEIWKGRMAQMETFWFDIPKTDRESCDFLNARRQVAKASGNVIREDQLESMGITPKEMKEALRDGGDKYDKVLETLAKNGDHLKKEDLFIYDEDGDTALNLPAIWNNFGRIVEDLAKNDIHLDPADFTKHHGTRNSPLVAAENAFNDGLTKLFNAEVWKGRPGAMLQLYENVREEKRDKIDLPELLAELIDATYVDTIKIDDSLTLSDLTTPLNANGEEAITGYEFRALGVDFVWSKIDDVTTSLKAKGEKITLADLKLSNGYGAETCLSSAIRKGHLQGVLDVLENSGERLTVEDLTAKVYEGETSLLDMIGETHKIPVLLTPENWQGRAEEFAQIWEALDEKYQKQVDQQEIVSAVNRGSLRERFRKRPQPQP